METDRQYQCILCPQWNFMRVNMESLRKNRIFFGEKKYFRVNCYDMHLVAESSDDWLWIMRFALNN